MHDLAVWLTYISDLCQKQGLGWSKNSNATALLLGSTHSCQENKAAQT